MNECNEIIAVTKNREVYKNKALTPMKTKLAAGL